MAESLAQGTELNALWAVPSFFAYAQGVGSCQYMVDGHGSLRADIAFGCRERPCLERRCLERRYIEHHSSQV